MSAALKALEAELQTVADTFVRDFTVRLVQGRSPVRLEPAQLEWLRGRLTVALTQSARHGQQYQRDSRRPPPLPAQTKKDDGPWPDEEATTKPQRPSAKR